MDALQMSYEFDVGYDYISGFQAPVLTNKEKSTFLTKAQEEVVLDYYHRDAYDEERNKVLDALKIEIVQTSVSLPGPYPNSKIVSTTDGIDVPLLVINESVDIFIGSKQYDKIRVKPIDDDYYHTNINNPFTKPSNELVWRIGAGGSSGVSSHIYILPDGYTLSSVYLYVYKRPIPIIIEDNNYSSADGDIDGIAWSSYTAASLDCDLNIIAHRRIVDKAVRMAYAALQEEKGYQISSIEEKQKENV